MDVKNNHIITMCLMYTLIIWLEMYLFNKSIWQCVHSFAHWMIRISVYKIYIHIHKTLYKNISRKSPSGNTSENFYIDFRQKITIPRPFKLAQGKKDIAYIFCCCHVLDVEIFWFGFYLK